MRGLILALVLASACHGQLVQVVTAGAQPSSGGGAEMVTRALGYYYEPALGDFGDSSKILDRSANNWDFVITGATWVSGGVSFDGVDDRALAPSVDDPDIFAVATAATIILVFEADSTETSGTVWARAISGTAFFLQINASGLFQTYYPGVFSRVTTGSLDYRGAFVFLAFRGQSGAQEIRVNPLTLDGAISDADSLNDSAPAQMAMGANNQFAQNPCDCIIAGLYAFTDWLSDAELQQQYDYVKATYPAVVTGDLP